MRIPTPASFMIPRRRVRFPACRRARVRVPPGARLDGGEAVLPPLDAVRWPVAHLGVGRECFGIPEPDHAHLPEHHRGNNPRPCGDREGEELIHLGPVDGTAQASGLLHIAVQVVEGLLSHEDGMADPDIGRDVPGEAQPGPGGRGGHRIELRDAESGVDLQVIPSLALLDPDALGGLLGRGHRAPAEAWAREVERRSPDLPGVRPCLQGEVAREAQHAAHGRHAVRGVEEHHLLAELVGREPAGRVAVHLGEPGEQVSSGAVDPVGPCR